MKLICANFKMNLLKKDIINYLNIIDNKISKNIVFFPSSLYLEYFQNYNYLIGSQDISFLEFGALTGDLSVRQLKDFNINYTLLGHSERREFYNDNLYLTKKVNLALNNQIKIIFCIGESKEIKDNNQTFSFLKEELVKVLEPNKNLLNDDNLIIAYEPIWSIGTGVIPEFIDIKNTISFIKDFLQETFHIKCKVLYGGSVNLTNILDLEKIKEIDGYLIGGACLDANKFLNLIEKIN